MPWTHFVPWLSRGGVVLSSWVSLFCAILHLTVFVRCELRFLGAGVSIFEMNFCNVSIHGDLAGPIGVPGIIIPSKVNSCKFCSFPVYGDLVVLLKSLEEMEGVFFSHIFDSEVINE